MKTAVVLLISLHLYIAYGQDANTTATPECKDTVDYCWTEPDENCFGIYYPWAKGHCPYRCGFCDDKPPCADKLDYCSQYDSSACTDPTFVPWARENCRKTCNLCALPKPPPGFVKGTTASSGQGSTNGGGNNPSGSVSPSPGGSNTGVPNLPSSQNTSTPNGAVLGGAKRTFIIQGPPTVLDGTCYYKGDNYQQDKNWYDGCDYICNCLDAKRNRIACTDRCTQWNNPNIKIDGCTWVQESGACCQRLECTTN